MGNLSRRTGRLATAMMVLIGLASISLVGHAEDTLLIAANNAPLPTTSNDWNRPLMVDPTVKPEQSKVFKLQATQQGATANQAATKEARSGKTIRRIAVVPHDYHSRYGVTPYDTRLGDSDCRMSGVYVSCHYTQRQ